MEFLEALGNADTAIEAEAIKIRIDDARGRSPTPRPRSRTWPAGPACAT